MNVENYFVQYLMAPIILIIGLIGNTFGLTVLLRKNMINVGPRNMYRYLFILDTSYLVFIGCFLFSRGFFGFLLGLDFYRAFFYKVFFFRFDFFYFFFVGFYFFLDFLGLFDIFVNFIGI